MSSIAKLLVVDDELNIRNSLKRLLEMDGFEVATVENGNEALKYLENNDVDVIISDLKMPQMAGDKLLKKVTSMQPAIPVIMITAFGTIDTAVELMKDGAFDFIEKPLKASNIIPVIKKAIKLRQLEIENRQLKKQLDEQLVSVNIIGKSPQIQKIFDLLKIISPTQSSVLITGENGTGKELIANAIHKLSDRKEMPFIKVHCAALNENLLESELFGHEKGAFTGAITRKKGRFELANNGTLFLDEIGEISQVLQVKLLRVLQEFEFERVGGEDTIKTDVRIIAATNKNLEKQIEEGNFREDLYYRLKVIHIELPPLRDRKTDIPLLVYSFIKEFAERNKKNVTGITPKAISLLENYRWQGNIRELRNVIERAVVICPSSIITEEELPDNILSKKHENTINVRTDSKFEDIEKEIILAVLGYYNGNKSKAASSLNIGRKTLHRKLEQYGITS